MAADPSDRLGQAVLERNRRSPPQAAQPVPVEAIPEVVAGPVGHGRDQRVRRAGERANGASELDVRDLVAAAGPYPASRDPAATRRPATRHASSTVCVPTTFDRTKSPASAMLRSTKDSAAAWITLSASSTSGPTTPASATSPRTNRNRGSA